MMVAYIWALHSHQMPNAGQCIDLYQVALIFRHAYDSSFTRKYYLF